MFSTRSCCVVLLLSASLASGLLFPLSSYAKEFTPYGSTWTTDRELEFTYDCYSKSEQIVALAFDLSTLPANPVFDSTFLQFFVFDPASSVGTVIIRFRAEINASPTPFGQQLTNVSRRLTSNSYIDWTPNEWSSDSINATGLNQLTPDLSPLLQELVTQPGWSSGSKRVVLIASRSPLQTTGANGTRVAFSGKDYPGTSPVLHLNVIGSGLCVCVCVSVSVCLCLCFCVCFHIVFSAVCFVECVWVERFRFLVVVFSF